jgi:hypothetical protein
MWLRRLEAVCLPGRPVGHRRALRALHDPCKPDDLA